MLILGIKMKHSRRVEKEEGNKVAEVGEFISDGKSFIKIQCLDGLINIKELQVEGKKRMTTEEYLRGMRVFPSKSGVFSCS